MGKSQHESFSRALNSYIYTHYDTINLNPLIHPNINIYLHLNTFMQSHIHLHRLKVLLPPKFLHLNTLLFHVLSPCLLRVRLDLALDSRVERAQDTRCQESGVDAVVDSDGCNGDACLRVSYGIGVCGKGNKNVPLGIWTMLYRLSTPSRELPFTGTPITGRAVWAAAIPGR